MYLCLYVFQSVQANFYPGQIWSTGRRIHNSRSYVYYVFYVSMFAYGPGKLTTCASVDVLFVGTRKNVYRYAHFFFFWLTSSYVEDSNKMTASCMFCVLQCGSWVRMGCSGSDVQLSHPPHIATHHIHEY
jgi:hypothetical protein